MPRPTTTSRCVRRAFLCGTDPHTQQTYEHRRQWVEDRILQLAEVFAIDVCAYAVMSNHLHVVLHINVSTAMHWSDQALCERWHKLYKGTALSQRFVRGEALDSVEMQTLQIKLDVWRLRLRDISWFMRTLNEPIARRKTNAGGRSGRRAFALKPSLMKKHLLTVWLMSISIRSAPRWRTPQKIQNTRRLSDALRN